MKNDKNGRCMMTGRLTSGKEVILASCAIDYVKKQGYLVSRARGLWSETI